MPLQARGVEQGCVHMTSDFTTHQTSNWQNLMMGACANVENVTVFQDRMLVRWAMLVEPNLDIRRVNRAFKKVCDRYDALRMTFHTHNGVNVARVHKQHPTGVTIREIGEVSDTDFQNLVEETAARPMSAVGGPVSELIVLKFGARGDVVIVRLHQIICDGYSVVLFIEDFFKYLMSIPIPFPAMTHDQFMRDWEIPDKEIPQHEAEFWQAWLLPAPDSPVLGQPGTQGKALMPPDIEGILKLDIPLVRSDIRRIEDLVKTSGISFYTYAYSAFGETLCDLGGVPSTYISTIVGRNDGRLNTYFGHYARLLVSIYQSQADKGHQARLRYTSDMLTEGLKMIERKGVRLENDLGRTLLEGGLRPYQFAVHTTMSYGRMKSSAFSERFMQKRGTPFSLGRYRVREIEITPPAEALAELQLNIEETSEGHSLSLAANNTSYSEDDLQRISKALSAKLLEAL